MDEGVRTYDRSVSDGLPGWNRGNRGEEIHVLLQRCVWWNLRRRHFPAWKLCGKKYWDARHNCFVYIIGENQETVRCSDDGEPSGTAGRPMLDVVQGAGLRNVLVVVTRYFGGTLLGTGGLVRAYSQAVQEGLANSVLIDEICGVRLLIETDYNGIGKIQYLLGQRGIPILESEYTDQVKIRVLVPKTEVDRLCAEITEGTNGKAKLEKEEELYFAQNDGELIFGDELTQYKNLEAEELG
mgnify:CR=1 FL=1